MRRNEENGSSGLFKAPSQYHETKPTTEEASCGDEVKAENKSESAHIEVILIQTHVNLKIRCQRRPGQLIKAIVALEDLRLTILHLNITSLPASVLYSFNLKVLICLFFLFPFFLMWSTLPRESSQCTLLLTCNLSKSPFQYAYHCKNHLF